MRTEVTVHDVRSGQSLARLYLVETIPSWVPMTRPQIDAIFGRSTSNSNGRSVGHCRLITADLETLSSLGLYDDRADGPHFYTYKKVKGIGITLDSVMAARGVASASPFSPPRPRAQRPGLVSGPTYDEFSNQQAVIATARGVIELSPSLTTSMDAAVEDTSASLRRVQEYMRDAAARQQTVSWGTGTSTIAQTIYTSAVTMDTVPMPTGTVRR